MQVSPLQSLLYCRPWLARVPGLAAVSEQNTRILAEAGQLVQETIARHQATRDSLEPRDYTDMALAEIERTTDPASSFHGQTGLDNLQSTLFDLFTAGFETISTTLTWGCLYMVRYPGVQARVQQELAGVVGEDRSPAMEDRPRLPYTEAVLMEVQRHANILPHGLRHRVTRQLAVRGAVLPAGTIVMPVMAEVLKGEHWGDGEVFRPERFLDSEGGVVKHERWVPFSLGRRQCLGETLARMQLFLFFSALLHRFSLLSAGAGAGPEEAWQLGLTAPPKPFQLRLEPRAGGGQGHGHRKESVAASCGQNVDKRG